MHVELAAKNFGKLLQFLSRDLELEPNKDALFSRRVARNNRGKESSRARDEEKCLILPGDERRGGEKEASSRASFFLS